MVEVVRKLLFEPECQNIQELEVLKLTHLKAYKQGCHTVLGFIGNFLIKHFLIFTNVVA